MANPFALMLAFPDCLRGLTVEDVIETVCYLTEGTMEELYSLPLTMPMRRAWTRLSVAACEDIAAAAETEEARCSELAAAIGL